MNQHFEIEAEKLSDVFKAWSSFIQNYYNYTGVL